MNMIASQGLKAAEPVDLEIDWWLVGEPESWMGLRASKAITKRRELPAIRAMAFGDKAGARPISAKNKLVPPRLLDRLSDAATAMFRVWRARRQFDELLKADNRMLDDIGLTRQEISRMAMRPLWTTSVPRR